jgi:diaminopimelate epimerase
VLRLGEGDQFTVNMGVPRHAPAEIPFEAAEERLVYQADIGARRVAFGVVSMGNPHAVLIVDDVDRAPVAELGPSLERHPLFPERVNVGFLQIVDAHQVRLRVFERGSGETLACGSGACAAAVAGIEQGLLRAPVAVSLPGGVLSIDWEGRGCPVSMTGPAVTVFEGSIEL